MLVEEEGPGEDCTIEAKEVASLHTATKHASRGGRARGKTALESPRRGLALFLPATELASRGGRARGTTAVCINLHRRLRSYVKIASRTGEM